MVAQIGRGMTSETLVEMGARMKSDRPASLYRVLNIMDFPTREVDPEKQAGVRIGLKSPPVLT
jgi:hypothetical protein